MEDVEKHIKSGARFLNELDFKKALSSFNKALGMDPNNAVAYFGKAEASIGITKLTEEEVVNFYQKAIELAPQNAMYHARFGGFCLDVGRFEEAEKCYNNAAELDPENARHYYSEFALDYRFNAKRLLDFDEVTNEKVKRIALTYLLKSLDIEKEDAVKLLSQ